jgi:ABC-type transport system involved in multi-copper enzyme maturation permease subunit
MNPRITIARQMVGAEFLKLRKKRSLLAWSSTLAVGSVVVYFVWRAVQHASNVHNGPAGGVEGFNHALQIIGIFVGPLAAVLIGAEAGAGDSASGVFRDLVVTGRSRAALFAARIPGALLLCLPVIAAGYGVGLIGTFLLSGGSPTPGVGTILNGLGWSWLVDGTVCVVAVGLAALTNSRPATITTLIGFELVASPILLSQNSLGSLRQVFLDSSVLHLSPIDLGGAPVIPESLLVALLVMAIWLLVASGLGAWRTVKMDA